MKNITEMTQAELLAYAQSLETRVAAQPSGGLKVSEKGGVSVYGLQRFPVTLYPQTWLTLLDKAAEIKAFIEANRDKLSWKEAKKAA